MGKLSKMKTFGCTLLVLAAVSCIGVVGYLHSLDLGSQPLARPSTGPDQLEMLKASRPAPRGRILAVATSTASIGTEVAAGMELTELSRAYYVFLANGFEVEIASPKGGRPPVSIDDELTDVDYAFLNDVEAQKLLSNTLPMEQVDASRYVGIYFVGGKGPMVDFHSDLSIQRVTAAVYDAGGVVGAVCHGPAALINVTLSDGQLLLADKQVTGFTNEEELFLIRNAREVFPFLLEDALNEHAREFTKGPKYLDHTVVDGQLVTGQNPWSTWSVAEEMIRALGYETVAREATAEERAVLVLKAYHRDGMKAAVSLRDQVGGVDKRLLLMHAVVAVAEGRLGDAYNVQRLAH